MIIAAAAAWVWRSNRHRAEENPYEDLAGPVSFSSRLVAGGAAGCTEVNITVGMLENSLWLSIAAYRALESEEEHPLFVDALAEVLAGKVAMAEARSAARASLAQSLLRATRQR